MTKIMIASGVPEPANWMEGLDKRSRIAIF